VRRNPSSTAKKLEYTSGIYKDVGANIAYSGPNGPRLAQALLDQHGGSMTADDRYAVATHISRSAQDTLDAAQRRQEASSARLVEQAKHDAQDAGRRAQRRISTAGFRWIPRPTPPRSSDAQTAEVGLLEEAAGGQFKNTTCSRTSSDTPVLTYQTRSTRCQRRSRRPGRRPIRTRSFSAMLCSSSITIRSEQLRSNGIAYAAQHLGMTPQPLNIMDPNSIDARVQPCAEASRSRERRSRRFSRPKSSLLPSNGGRVTGAKANLVMNLAKFGSLAPAAAQQIAPNDAGLVHLIGLASHSNRGVAISRVNQAMAGYEAMKTEGKLVGKTAKQPDFNTWTGSALQFMPGAKDGVFTVAKALLAQDASAARLER
jgi:hypothetical protein